MFIFVISITCTLFLTACKNDKSNYSVKREQRQDGLDIAERGNSLNLLNNEITDKEDIFTREQQAKSSIAAHQARELMQVIENETETISSESAYPDYFAGIYLDDNFDLVLVITEDTPEKFRRMAEERVKGVKLHLQRGDFSLNELKETQEKLNDFFIDSAPESIRDNLISVGLNIKTNRITI